MAASSTFTPKASLTEAPTNLKEAIDWVLRVTGRDGKALSGDECICGLAAAVTDLLQSVELEYNGYEGDVKDGTTDSSGNDNRANPEKVKGHLNGLFSLVQGLGGTSVVRTYIDQLAQVLSALVGWSSIPNCGGMKSGSQCKGTEGDDNPHGKQGCGYLEDVMPNTPCTECGCMKWEVPDANDHTKGHHLGRRCQRCSDEKQKKCECSTSGAGGCSPGKECQCALAGRCCKCCCKEECKDKCQKDAKCSCVEEEKSYKSAYRGRYRSESYVGGTITAYQESMWNSPTNTPTRQKCAKILLGSVCLIWSGITYMYWTGKYASTSPRWNNHILDGTGLDDGTLSQWLQALGFPRGMLNNSGPGNRLDAVIWNGLSDKLLLGFAVPSGLFDSGVHDKNDNTARQPAGMNYPGFIHTAHRDSFNNNGAIVFTNGSSSTSDIDQHKRGAIFKLYILSCAYFTGLQKRNSESTPRTPRTIREILYWLSALPYSQAYPEILKHGKGRLKEVLKKPDGSGSTTSETQLKFTQQGRSAPITVDEFNLFAHFQAVTQYCPLVLIGIQGGIHSPKGTDNTKEPAIHALYANTECRFTYPTVPIQAYNQVVHYIRGLFYQLYFLRKQCAVKVALGGKWRECRYGDGVVSKGVISWMCLGCDPMEHDRKSRVKEMGRKLGTVLDKVKVLEWTREIQAVSGTLVDKIEKEDNANKLKALLEAIGQVVVQLGNAQEALEGRKGEEITKVKVALQGAKGALEKAKKGLETVKGGLDGEQKLKEAMTKLGELTNGGRGGGNGGILGEVDNALGTAQSDVKNVDPGKNRISEAIDGVHKGLELIKEWAEQDKEKVIYHLKEPYNDFLSAIDHLISTCNTAKCHQCDKHSTKCGQPSTPTQCPKCLQPTTTGVPSPLQAFLEDRLPGFSCQEVVNDDKENPVYPPAASHLGHCGGSGQCCPLPMGFRGNFHKGSTSNMTGQRLYGILYFFSNENMMQSCVYTLVRVTAELSATTPQVLGDVFGFFRGGVGNKDRGKTPNGSDGTPCNHDGNPSGSYEENKTKYFCGWCASGLRDEVQKIEWIKNEDKEGTIYRKAIGKALRDIKGEKGSSIAAFSSTTTTTSDLSRLTTPYLSPLTGELYTAVSATFGHVYLSWVLYLSDALEGGLKSLASEFKEIECRGCKGQCDPNKCRKGEHGQKSDGQVTGLCGCQSIVSCTGVLPVLYRHGFSYGNPFNLEGYQQEKKDQGDYSITDKDEKTTKHCHEFLESLSAVIDKNKQDTSQTHPLTNLLSQVGQLQYDIRLPWIFVLTVAWLIAVLYLAFGAIWPLDWTHMRSHWLRGGEHQWQCMWYKVMTGRKGVELVEYFGRK